MTKQQADRRTPPPSPLHQATRPSRAPRRPSWPTSCSSRTSSSPCGRTSRSSTTRRRPRRARRTGETVYFPCIYLSTHPCLGPTQVPQHTMSRRSSCICLIALHLGVHREVEKQTCRRLEVDMCRHQMVVLWVRNAHIMDVANNSSPISSVRSRSSCLLECTEAYHKF